MMQWEHIGWKQILLSSAKICVVDENSCCAKMQPFCQQAVHFKVCNCLYRGQFQRQAYLLCQAYIYVYIYDIYTFHFVKSKATSVSFLTRAQQ